VQVLLEQAGVTSIHTSLSHDTEYAVAEVVLTKNS
jgi:phosphopantetheinyl transferase (holo-ACP synthase)